MSRLLRQFGALALLGPLSVSPALTFSIQEQASVSLNELVRETQKQSEAPGKLSLVWWLPEEFWSVSFRKDGSMSQEKVEEFLEVIRPYLVVAAVDGEVGFFGGSKFADRDKVRGAISVIDAKGTSVTPIPEEELTADVKILAAALQSMLGNMLGAMGQGIYIFFFPSQSSDGSIIAEATNDGAFAVRLGEETFRWRLPLSSLLPSKVCPEDGERMSGAWKYCPWHGNALVGPE